MNKVNDILKHEALALLKQLVATPSFSKEEDKTASVLGKFFAEKNIQGHRAGNNVYALNKHFDPEKPVLLLNSHHDTVKPNTQYSRDPFDAAEVDGKLFGLGSNDAGGCLVSLIAVFCHFYERNDLKY